MKCPKCNGELRKSICDFCFGKHELDWIEVIKGVQRDPYEYSQYYNSSFYALDEPPDSPEIGDSYINTDSNKLYMFDGTQWLEVTT